MRAMIIRAGIIGAGLLAAGPAAALADTPECAAADTPAAQLACRDPALAAAGERLDATIRAFGESAGAAGRDALAAGQRAWVQRRDAACPVAAPDLAEPKRAKERAGCLLRLTAERTRSLEDEMTARKAPPADQPLSITDSAPPRLAPPPVRQGLPKRQAGVPALAGRWAKADPTTRTPIDDCRTSYLELTKEQQITLRDPRIPGFPVEGRVTLGEGDPAQGLPFAAEGGGPKGHIRLDAAEAPRLDRLFLRLEQPVGFGATFVRCR